MGRRAGAGRRVCYPGGYSALSHLECSRCAVRHDATVRRGTCGCAAPLLARYATEAAGNLVTPAVAPD